MQAFTYMRLDLLSCAVMQLGRYFQVIAMLRIKKNAGDERYTVIILSL